MNRRLALGKLYRICERLDAVNPSEFFVIPLRLYVFGSLLTDKPNPTDIDLLFQYRERSDLDADKIVRALSYGKPLPHERAIKYLRKGMQMIRFEILPADTRIELWLQDHAFDVRTPFKLIWKRGLDWKSALQKIETQPLQWNPAAEQWNKYVQETGKRIKEEKGERAAAEWIKTVKSAGAGKSG
jgi:hypothetical protein